MKKLTPRLWLTLVLVGLSGQFAWTVENMYFNVFLYNTISTDPVYIAAMVAASAVVATLTTLLMGVLSDRLGRRKAFVCIGYILWGISTSAFGLITVESATKLFPAVSATSAAAMMVIVLDCAMTFFGSGANDAAFNAYVTDIIEDDQRGKVEGVLAMLPLFSMLVVFVALNGMTLNGEWRKFFFIIGSTVFLTGVAACFLMKEQPFKPRGENAWLQLSYGFRPSVIRANRGLYCALLAMFVLCVSAQVFMPYLLIYLQHRLVLDNYAVTLGIALITASVISVIGGRAIDRIGKLRFAIPSALMMLAGLLAMYFAGGMAWVSAAGALLMSGYMLLSATVSACVRVLTPPEKAGHFQGMRMIFAVMMPMVIGPYIGAWVIRGNGETYVDMGQIKTVPTPDIFLAAAAVLIFIVIPLALLRREERVAAQKPAAMQM